jgi:hypothetical protein
VLEVSDQERSGWPAEWLPCLYRRFPNRPMSEHQQAQLREAYESPQGEHVTDLAHIPITVRGALPSWLAAGAGGSRRSAVSRD